MKPLASSARQPFSQSVLGSAPSHDEDVPDLAALDFARLLVPPLRTLEVVAALERGELGMRVQFNLRILFDAQDEIAGHGVGESHRRGSVM